MPRAKSATPRKSVWDKDYRPYGTYEGARGDADAWREAFKYVWSSVSEAKEFIKEETPFDILGIPAGSTFEVAKAAYRKLMLKIHPDKAQTPEQRAEFEELSKRANAAMEVLEVMLKGK